MKLSKPIILLTLLALGLSTGSANAKQPTIDTSPDALVTVDGLHPIKDPRLDVAYAKADLDLSAYNKVMLAPVSIAYKKRSFELNEKQVTRMHDYFNDALNSQLGEHGYQVVNAPGPDVLLVEASIIDLLVNRPPEPSVGRTTVFTASSGEMTLIGELKDSQSGEILARFADRKRPRNYWAKSTSVSEWSEVRRAFKSWAKILRERLDVFHGKS